MELLNQIGHIQHWGFTPAANILKFYDHPQTEKPIKVLLSGCCDIRHILKTLADCPEGNQIEIYIHETKKELLCRDLLFLHLIHETKLNFEERVELFLDLYGNSLLKQRNAKYLHQLRNDLLNFIHDEKKVVTPLKKFVSLKLLLFPQRDEMSEFIQSWQLKTPFDMPKYRESKLRYDYKERYDYKNNLIDWEYNMLLMPCAPIVHYYHYKEWKLTGLAYEQRFSTYCEPNRTLASYAPGKKKQEGTTCLVRGYWGDIVLSPYIAMGTTCDYPQKDLLFKKANYKYIGNSVELSEYNLTFWLHKLETGEQYHKIFNDYYRCDEEAKKKLEKRDEDKKLNKEEMPTIEEDADETKEQELKKEEEEEIQEKQEDKDKDKEKEKEEQKPSLQLDEDEQKQRKNVLQKNAKEIEVNDQEQEPLLGLQKHRLQIHLMGQQPQKLIRDKYFDFFDVVVIGFGHSAYLSKGVTKLVRPEGQLLVENATYLVPKKKEDRQQLNIKIKDIMKGQEHLQKINNQLEGLYVYERKKQ